MKKYKAKTHYKCTAISEILVLTEVTENGGYMGKNPLLLAQYTEHYL